MNPLFPRSYFAMKTLFAGLFFCLAALALTPVPAPAQDLGGLRRNMESRLAEVDAAKAKGVVGETLRGLLEVRGTADEAVAKLVAAENADRQAVYAAIARSTQSTPEAVATARARQIAAGSKPGVWLQKEDGGWYRK